MNYRQPIHFLEGLTRFGIKLGLEPIRGLLFELGNPQEKYPSIHIAGTNGKGSTASFIASILSEAGYKVGLYTSPHLFEATERITLSGKPISKRKFASLIANLVPAIKKRTEETGIPLTYFEVLTAAAFQYFAQEEINFLVAETGMGGRLDATNILKPLICVLTPISLEHTTYLGNNLSAIAFEKCGIIKKGSIVVSSPQKRAVTRVIRKVCKEKTVPLYLVDKKNLDEDASFKLRLSGEFQRENAALAIAVAKTLSSSVFPIKEKNIKEGLRKTKISGRFQILSQKPLIIYDVGHNPDAVKVLCKSLKKFSPGKKYIFVYGSLKDKDSRKIIQIIAPLAKLLILTQSKSKRARPAKDLFRVAKEYLNEEKIKAITHPDQPLKFALKDEAPICIFGSFYLAPYLKTWLSKRQRLFD